MPTAAEREVERAKYIHVYDAMGNRYKMGGDRVKDAKVDLRWAQARGAQSYLDIGCGRGEMIDFAERLGYPVAIGTEIVPALCEPANVYFSHVHQLHIAFDDSSYDFVTSFDVIEHILPPDDTTLITHLGRIARHSIALTANNRDSIDPTTGNQLHVNKRPYDEWEQLIRGILEPEWTVERMAGKRYVSETWRAWR